jgi:hypothetical protein
MMAPVAIATQREEPSDATKFYLTKNIISCRITGKEYWYWPNTSPFLTIFEFLQSSQRTLVEGQFFLLI